MNRNTWFQRIVVALSSCTLLLPPGIQAAEGIESRATVRDVALGADGDLHGTLLSTEGKPQGNSEVVLRKGTEMIGRATTEADGKFTIRQVRPGLYELATSQSSNLYRVWTARSAPPAAQPAALVVQGNKIVRGQEWSPVRRALILGGVIITSGVIGGVIGYNIKDDNSAS